MTIAIMQPYFFPYIGYFQLINAVDKFIIYDDVNFINKGWINRNNILANGRPLLITIPLKEASQNKLINGIDISCDKKTIGKIIKTIEINYKKAPFFDVFGLVKECLENIPGTISDYNVRILKAICAYIGISTIFVDSSSLYLNKELKGEQRIVDICVKEKADKYINPIGGTGLYSKNLFTAHGIKLNFMNNSPVEYSQFSSGFVPSLSIIDVLMFNSRQRVKKMLDQYALV